MIRHIVLIRFLPAQSEDQIAALFAELHAINGKVPGLLAITGMPPFGIFVSEFTMLRAVFAPGREWMAVVALLALAVAFAGMARTFLSMALGPVSDEFEPAGRREHRAAFGPALALLAASLWLGLWIPNGLNGLLGHAARLLGGDAP